MEQAKQMWNSITHCYIQEYVRDNSISLHITEYIYTLLVYRLLFSVLSTRWCPYFTYTRLNKNNPGGGKEGEKGELKEETQ